ncbi:enoyl-CoA hydratase family protein [Streptomyces bathyalis]|uniref:Enoyl-CoA hydratase family protein n=1 Tax=Streptomyces bathyalis TaxID=2710756 RepID=A0A7T1WT53_9ACTN|nr:enoyl-CoA hydratase family protein [Streptomyces bathyalis]QPP08229.1 enoyl-CoA hydratase family protein [Streptomyces bathyalis]
MTGSAEEAKPEGQLVRSAHERGITTLTLDSPHNRNALSKGLVSELYGGLERAADDPRVRAVLLTHTGGTFCAGADLREGSGSPGDLAALLRTIVELPKPVVARVDGHVRAGGTGLLGACDISVAGPASTFAFTEARIGVAPAVISMPLLPRLDARAAARYYLTGERFGAAEAARIGLVTLAAAEGSAEAGDDGEGGADGAGGVDAALEPLLDGLRKGSPQGLAESKRLVTAEVLRAFDRDTDSLAELSARLFASDEAREGMTAFLERREPAWVD